MKALRYPGDGSVELIEAPIPVCGEGELLIQVKAAGICGTDIGDFIYRKDFCGIPGHEVSGVVVYAGNSDFRAGDRVMLSVHITCRTCDACHRGDAFLCRELKVFGTGTGVDGGMAEYIKVPAQVVHPLPDNLSFETGCLVCDALATAYGAVDKLVIAPGARIAVLGAGPIGLLAMLVASSRGAEVFALDFSAARLELAREYGARHAIQSGDAALEEALRLTGGKGMDAVIQCATSAQAVIDGLRMLRDQGTMVQVSGTHEVTLDVYDMLNERELTIVGSHNGNEFKIGEYVHFAQEHREVERIVTNRYPLAEAPRAFEAAKRHEGVKTVLLP